MEEYSFVNPKGVPIHWVKWMPETEPVAVLQIVHGVSEHVERYAELAEFLNYAGIIVAAEDHMGHGQSVNENCGLGCFNGGWLDVAGDCHTLQTILSMQYAGLPYFLLGHSMGSFLVRTMLYTWPDMKLSGALISGTAWQPEGLLALGKILCWVDCKIHGSEHVSGFINSLAFGSYNSAFKPAETKHDWICSDPSVVAAYEADSLSGYDVSSGLAFAMMDGLQNNQKTSNLKRMPQELPIFFYAGKMDPVGSMGKGVEQSAEAFRRNGMQKIELKLYEGRHEMHNEPNKAQVYGDILEFIQKNS